MFGRKDPVCGARVNKKTGYCSKYEGKTYYFDCPACKATFDGSPSRFIKKGEGLVKWLAKGGENAPKSCH